MQKKSKIILGTSAAVVVVLGVSAAAFGPAFYRDVIVGAPAAAPSVSADPADSTLDTSDLSGEWNIGTGSTAGYRVAEVLNGTDVTVVGKTEDVSGTITVDGSTLKDATVKVDVGTIATDQAPRDDYFRGTAMEVAKYPDATFTLTQPVDAAVPASGQVATVQATGELTMHGVTQTVTVPLQAALSGDGVQVSGSIPVTFSDYGVQAPSLGFVSVQDTGTVEFLVKATPAK
ncbi:YceI family protein [Clavibacter nebraskensis]|uniref:YceI family protein n=2 Tax=Clavibacter nebraskensis TaxID=31963 RepID=A0A399Q1K7_9MICO|nr:YceI family protein [Clavibacter nebraskensis]KXU21915.1 polyisoprenoid-binding protein [Clavibacter nebraskensis]OAH18829.1 polyisoprenoid-binding protein [Clavibacter nebraskensis]QGV65593.1 YceI family protein [Clavibacter nebraskensis]QGV68391.1 YceI family protein [Clavibacter nebraskensis]QGV71182.1 YceI family protein [Clavibacter nebraskensis]